MHYVFAIAIALILYFIQQYYYSRHWNRNLSAVISYDRTHANIGDTIVLTEQITNKKMLPLPVLHVKFSTSRTFLFDDMSNATVSDYYHRNDIFSIMGNQQITRTLQFRTTRRGYFATEYVSVVANDLFLHSAYATKFDNHTSLYVYPMLLKDRDSLSITNSILGEIVKRDLYEDPLSFRGIRDYVNGDSMRYINWKATAKATQLMVNTYFDNQNTEVILLFNLDTNIMQRDNRLQEYMISIVATLLYHMNNHGFATRLAINIPDPFTNEIPVTDLGTGDEHLRSILQILSRLDLSRKTTPFADFFAGNRSMFDEAGNHTSYLVVSNYRKEQLMTLYTDKLAEGYHLHFICPELISSCVPAEHIQYWEVNPHEL